MVELTDSLVGMLVRTQFEDLPASTIDSVKRSTLDILGCMLAGASAPECTALVKMFASLEGGASRVIGRSQQVSAPWAALVNGTAGRALDMDDIYEPGECHATVAVVPVLLAIADMLPEPINGREFIVTVATAIDLMGRLAEAPRRDSEATGLSHSYQFGVFAGAATAARALNCDQVRTRSALGLALGMAGGTRQPNIEGVGSIRVQQGWAAHSGLMAGLLAKNDIGGPSQVFEGKFGYFNVYHANQWDADVLLDALGTRFAVDSLTLKLYPACNCAHGAIDGILNLRRRHNLAVDDIARVRVRVPPMSYALVLEPEEKKRSPNTIAEAQFSLPYLIAAALVRGKVTIEELSPQLFRSDLLRSWSRRIEVDCDADLVGSQYSLAAADIEITLHSGQRLHEEVRTVPGGLGRPCTFGEVAGKVNDLLAPMGTPPNKLSEIVEMVGALDSLPDIRHLSQLL